MIYACTMCLRMHVWQWMDFGHKTGAPHFHNHRAPIDNNSRHGTARHEQHKSTHENADASKYTFSCRVPFDDVAPYLGVVCVYVCNMASACLAISVYLEVLYPLGYLCYNTLLVVYLFNTLYAVTWSDGSNRNSNRHRRIITSKPAQT